MPNLEFMIKGLLAGLAIAAPVGPTTVLVVQRTIRQNLKTGLKSGAGAAVADAFFGAFAIFGASFVAGFIYSHVFIIKLTACCFLLFWGTRIFISRFAEAHPLVKGEGKGGPFISTFILTLTNPMTLLAFMAILAGLGAAYIRRDIYYAIEWIVGLGSGSFVWWLFLSVASHTLREKFDIKIFGLINRIIGAIVVIAGVLILFDILK